MKQLYIDFDGVILDTMSKTYKVLEESGIDKNDYDKVRSTLETWIGKS